jgi:hypothetical protein
MFISLIDHFRWSANVTAMGTFITSNRSWLWVALCAVCIGCSACSQIGSQFGEEDQIIITGGKPLCRVAAIGVLPSAEHRSLGFSAQSTLDWASGRHTETLGYANGSETTLTLDVRYGGAEIRFRQHDSSEDADLCADAIEIDLSVSFSTEDGAFAETWDETLVATSADVAGFQRRLDTLEGSFDPADYLSTESRPDEIKVTIVSFLRRSGLVGEVRALGTNAERAFDSSEAYASTSQIARWPSDDDQQGTTVSKADSGQKTDGGQKADSGQL